jgi:hypothetical protein
MRHWAFLPHSPEQDEPGLAALKPAPKPGVFLPHSPEQDEQQYEQEDHDPKGE